MKKIPYFLLLLLAFSSCSKVKWSDVTVNNKYSLKIPSYLEAGNFSKDASLQYMNPDKEIYMLMIDEDKAQFVQYGLDYDLNTYFKVSAHTYDSTGTATPRKFKIGQDSARSADYGGAINGNDVLFKVVTIETKTCFYKMIIWMMMRDKEAYAGDVEKIISSFHELNNSKGPVAPSGKTGS